MAGADDFCRERALAEPVWGTAKAVIHRWVLVEDGKPWRAKVPRDSDLPPEVVARLLELEAQPHTRVQMIRRPGQGCGPRRRVFIVEAPRDPARRQVVALVLDVDALATLDPAAVLARHRNSPGSGPDAGALDQLWLVCTHGTRDRCCAKWGIPVWDQVSARVPDRAWQTSHLGGHRFAPTFLVLPAALVWGRVPVDAVDPLAASLAAGELGALDHCRGRASYPVAAQRAEIELRRTHGWLADDALELRRCSTLDEGRFEVEFATPQGLMQVLVDAVAGPPTPSNCGDQPSRRISLTIAATGLR